MYERHQRNEILFRKKKKREREKLGDFKHL